MPEETYSFTLTVEDVEEIITTDRYLWSEYSYGPYEMSETTQKIYDQMRQYKPDFQSGSVPGGQR